MIGFLTVVGLRTTGNVRTVMGGLKMCPNSGDSMLLTRKATGGVFPTTTTTTTTKRCRPFVSSSATTEGPIQAAEMIQRSNVMVFSTTYCPYCDRVKSLFNELQVEYIVWDMDNMANGDSIRAWLLESTGQRTVPNVFIKGEHVGGCDDTFALYQNGKLLTMIDG